jgi:hypothetical protein
MCCAFYLQHFWGISFSITGPSDFRLPGNYDLYHIAVPFETRAAVTQTNIMSLQWNLPRDNRRTVLGLTHLSQTHEQIGTSNLTIMYVAITVMSAVVWKNCCVKFQQIQPSLFRSHFSRCCKIWNRSLKTATNTPCTLRRAQSNEFPPITTWWPYSSTQVSSTKRS